MTPIILEGKFFDPWDLTVPMSIGDIDIREFMGNQIPLGSNIRITIEILPEEID